MSGEGRGGARPDAVERQCVELVVVGSHVLNRPKQGSWASSQTHKQVIDKRALVK